MNNRESEFSPRHSHDWLGETNPMNVTKAKDNDLFKKEMADFFQKANYQKKNL